MGDKGKSKQSKAQSEPEEKTSGNSKVNKFKKKFKMPKFIKGSSGKSENDSKAESKQKEGDVKVQSVGISDEKKEDALSQISEPGTDIQSQQPPKDESMVKPSDNLKDENIKRSNEDISATGDKYSCSFQL